MELEQCSLHTIWLSLQGIDASIYFNFLDHEGLKIIQFLRSQDLCRFSKSS